MSKTPEETRDYMLALALRTYKLPAQRAAMRCALGDAAAVCDVLATAIMAEHRHKRGKAILKQGLELAAIAKRCGDFIWEMREAVPVYDPPLSTGGSVMDPDPETKHG